MALLLIAGPVLLLEFRGEHAGQMEGASVVMSLAAVLLTIYGIKQLAMGTASLVPAVTLVVGAAVGVVFARRQLQVETPLLGVLAAVVYRSRMHGTSDFLAGAVAASRYLPDSQGTALLHAAREAFTASLHVTGVVVAVIFTGLAVLILTMHPATRSAPAAPPGHEATRS